ncbi:MAG: SMI1/KNR4 family protein [Phycisphaerales bacterium]|nr:SMI1/KNR4 family protein [Phycisphaerales bacterium]
MTLDDLIERAVELAREEVCFNLTNEFPTRAEWEEAERQVGHMLPEAWLRFVDKFGCGQISVSANAPILEFKVSDYTNSSFYIDNLMGPSSFVRDWDFFTALDLPGEVPQPPFGQVGYPGDGDVLFIKCGTGSDRPENGELLWWDHELFATIYRWPTVEAWLGHMLQLHGTGEPRLLGKKREAANRVEAFATKARDVLLREGEVAPLPATPNKAGAVQCPHCNWTFNLSSKGDWNGKIHYRCGKPITIVQ